MQSCRAMERDGSPKEADGIAVFNVEKKDGSALARVYGNTPFLPPFLNLVEIRLNMSMD